MAELINGLTRKENIEAKEKVMGLLNKCMRESLAEIARSKGGLNVLRWLLHESGFLAPLTHMTATGVNKDVLLSNEAKRTMYLGLRQYMDETTIVKIELEGVDKLNKGGKDE